MTFWVRIGWICAALSLPTSSFSLSPSELSRLLVSELGSSNLPAPATGSTARSVRSSGVAGLIGARGYDGGYIYLAVGADRLCRFWAHTTTYESFTALTAETSARLLQEAGIGGACNGVLFAPGGRNPHLFLRTAGSTGLWVPPDGSPVPVLRMPEKNPNAAVAYALVNGERPTSVIALGKVRFALSEKDGAVSVRVLNSGSKVLRIPICDVREDHPLFRPSEFARYGSKVDAAFQTVFGAKGYDPLAYVACP